MQNPDFVRKVFTSIAGRYDFANHLLSGGLDFFWRNRVAKMVKQWNPALLLDLATGSGDLALALQKKCPQTRVTGADFCHPMLLEAQRKGLGHLVTADGMALPFADGTFDAVTVAFGLRNMASWPVALREMGRVLKPGGHLLVLDFSMPDGWLRPLYRSYLHGALPWIAGCVTGDRGAYAYLGESIEKFPAGESMCSLIESQGFCEAQAFPMTMGIVSIYTANVAK